MGDDERLSWDVRLEVGPVDGRLAHAWLTNARRVVSGVRRHPLDLSISTLDPILDLLEVYLDLWIDAASDVEVFHWRSIRDARQLLAVATEWSKLAAMTPEDFAVIGCSRAPVDTQPFVDALLDGLARSLASHPETDEAAARLLTRPPPGPATTHA